MEKILQSQKQTEGQSENENESQKIQTLMDSVATLSAEKSRMEQSFQADKKQLRQELLQKDKQLKEAHDKLHNLTAQQNLEFENYRSKLIVERHNQEKSHNESLLMIRELQKLLSDERHLKENLEMQLNDLKTQFSKTSNEDKTVKEMSEELENARKKLKGYENASSNFNNSLLDSLNAEIVNLKQQHKIAIENEQKRTFNLNEQNKRLAEIHEERVANLEARLAELSNTVGSYHRLRSEDQDSINKLKEKLSNLQLNQKPFQPSEKKKFSMSSLIEEILNMKYLLIEENSKLAEPIDLSKIFKIETKREIDQSFENLRHDLERRNQEVEKLKKIVSEKLTTINNLQEKIKVLNRNIDEMESELKTRELKHESFLKTEKNKWQNLLTVQETEFRSKISQLEQQLQNQRERSLTLLEDKESEIRSIKAFYETFSAKPSDDHHLRTSSESDTDFTERNQTLDTPTSNTKIGEFHIIHFSNELARKDLELSNLRKAKREAENMFRKAMKEKIMIKEEMDEKISILEQEIKRWV